MLNHESISQENICLKLNNKIHLQQTKRRPQKGVSLCNICMLNQVSLPQERVCLKINNRVYLYRTEIETSKIILIVEYMYAKSQAIPPTVHVN